jgi:hypothetical protein
MKIPFKVICINDKKSSGCLVKNGIYEVLVIVKSGVDYHNKKCSGYIVHFIAETNVSYPYIWDKNRFEIIE